MPKIDLDAIEARANAATKGELFGMGSSGWTGVFTGEGYTGVLFAKFISTSDEMFFIEARKDIIALIEKVKRQRKLLDKWGRQATKQRQKRHALSNVLE